MSHEVLLCFFDINHRRDYQRMDENYSDNYWETVRRNNFNLPSLLFHFLEKEKLHDADED